MIFGIEGECDKSLCGAVDGRFLSTPAGHDLYGGVSLLGSLRMQGVNVFRDVIPAHNRYIPVRVESDLIEATGGGIFFRDGFNLIKSAIALPVSRRNSPGAGSFKP